MKTFPSHHLSRVVLVLTLSIAMLIPAGSSIAWGASTDLLGPGNSGAFGSQVKVLPNGNLVVTDPKYSPPSAANAGAVYLYNGTTHSLISTLTGSQAGDTVGSEGITVLGDGSFVVKSTAWANGTNTKAGAATWCSATLGCSGEVSPTNSLVGSYTDDQIGFYGVGQLDGSAFLIKSPLWNHVAGALTYCADGPSCKGVVDSSNSLIGSTAGDMIGALVYVLPGQGYISYSSWWHDGGNANVGAVTGCPMTGCTGTVSTANSLHGSAASDSVGVIITPLAGEGFVVSNLYWAKPDVGGNAGAATYCATITACNGLAVSTTNSLTGSYASNFIGGNILALPNGDYVVGSMSWNSGSAYSAGAVTYCHVSNGSSDCTNQVISAANSLIGTHNADSIGGGLVALSNSNYITNSSSWNSYTGAVTFCSVSSGTSTCTGQVVSASNSLVGTNSSPVGTDGDQVSRDGVQALEGGGYTVASSYWDNGSVDKAGAVTYCPPTGCIGAVTAANSLTGSTTNDAIGNSWVRELTTGNYVVMSQNWANGPAANAGAVTFCTVSMDHTSSSCTGQTVSAANSLVGSTAGDTISSSYNLVSLSNGGYLIGSPNWSNSGTAAAGAITFCPATGCSGPITAENSLLGTQANEMAGYDYYPEAADGYYVAPDLGYQGSKGAVSLCSITTGCSNPISSDNSVIGGVAISDWSLSMTYEYDSIHHQLVVGRPAENLVTFFTLGSPKTPTTMTLTSSSPEDSSTWGDTVTLTATVSPAEATGTVTFSDAETAVCTGVALDTGTHQATCSTSDLDAGSHSLTSTYSGDESYETSTSDPLTQMVNQATLSVTADDKVKTYGDADPSFAFTYGSFVHEDTASVIAVSPTCDVIGVHNVVGDYEITCSGGSDNNYEFSYSPGTLTIQKKTASVTVDPANKTYGDSDPSFSGTLSGFLAGDGVTASYSRTPGESIPGSPYTISATLAPVEVLSNYEITSTSANFTIQPRTITVTADAQGKTYGDADPELTYQVTSGSLVGSDSFSGNLTRTGTEQVDSYDIQQGTLTASANYTLTYVGNTLVIHPKPASVTPSTASKTYGDTDPTFTGTLSGFLSADSVSATYSRTAGETVTGAYTISAVLSPVEVLSNYDITYNTAAFKIEKRDASVTPDAASKTYGDSDPGFSGMLSGFLPADGVSATYTRAAGESVSGGPYTISVATVEPAEVLGNYNIINGTADFTILPRQITVTADPQSKAVGAADPDFTYQITGGSLVSPDEFAGNLTRTAGETSGSYPILQGSLALSQNYSLTYVGANLTIGKISTTTTVSISPESTSYHQPVTLTAQVTSTSGTVSGTVIFMDGRTILATDVPLQDGQALYIAEGLPGGPHEFSAEYSGGETFSPSSAASLPYTIGKANAEVTITSNLSHCSPVNQPYTVDVTVTAAEGAPTGTVTVSDGKEACQFDLSDASSCQLASTTAGNKSITATYSGDGNFQGSQATATHPVWYIYYFPIFIYQP